MRQLIALALASLASLLPAPADAQISVSGTAEIVSDYRFRGVSLSNEKPALQASAEAEAGGFYLGGFASWVPVAGGAPATEFDATIGTRATLGGGLTLDSSVAWYHYPGTPDCDYAEASATLGWERGDTSARAGLAWAPRQPNLVDAAGRRSDNLYGFAGAEAAISGTPLSVAIEAGYETGAFDGAGHGGKVDWRAGLTLSHRGFDVSAHYVGAARFGAVAGERRRERGLVLAIGRSF